MNIANNNIIHNWIIPGYFIFAVLDLVAGFLGYDVLQKFSLFYLIICTYYVFIIKDKHCVTIDFLIILLFIEVVLGILVNNIEHELVWSGIRYQMLLMIFFFIGKYYLFNNRFMEIGKYIILGNALLGLYLFISAPSWYISWKSENVSFDITQGDLYYEMTRLSSISTYPYWVSYSSCILYLYFLESAFMFRKSASKREYIILTFLLIIMILCQQRAPIMFSVMSTILILFSRKQGHQTASCIQIIFILILMSFAIVTMFNYIDEDQKSFILEKLNSIIEGDDLVANRTKNFMLNNEITVLGEGIGKYSHTAIGLNKKSIADQQYLRIIYETGIAGCLLYFMVFVNIILRGLKYKKECTFDLLVILFYLFSMFGANSLSMEGYHTAVFWFCCGRLFNDRYIEFKQIKKTTFMT